MAQAVKRLFPAVRVAIGPAIEDGFYYDFAKGEPFTPEDLVKIEEVMREIAKADHAFERQEMSREDAIRFFRERGEPFKPIDLEVETRLREYFRPEVEQVEQIIGRDLSAWKPPQPGCVLNLRTAR